MRRTLYNHTRARATLAIAARTATANGTAVDRTISGASGTNEWFGSAMLVVQSGTMTDGSHAITLQESDDNAAWSNVAAADLQGSLPTITSADSNKLYEVGYTGIKRYLRAVTTVTGATTGGTYAAVVVLGFPNVLPVSRT